MKLGVRGSGRRVDLAHTCLTHDIRILLEIVEPDAHNPPVHSVRFPLLSRRHLYHCVAPEKLAEAETPRRPGLPIRHDTALLDRSKLNKIIIQISLRCARAQPANENFTTVCRFFRNFWSEDTVGETRWVGDSRRSVFIVKFSRWIGVLKDTL